MVLLNERRKDIWFDLELKEKSILTTIKATLATWENLFVSNFVV